MNQVYITSDLKTQQKIRNQGNSLILSFQSADQYLQILRSDYFNKITIKLPQNVNDKQLKLMMHLTRIIKNNAQIIVQNARQSSESSKFNNLAVKIGLYQIKSSQNKLSYSKNKPTQQELKANQKIKKLSIGFKSLAQEQIDQQDLMKNQNISIKKLKPQNCGQKPRACANCNCGRKDDQKPEITKQKLVQSVNDGNPVSGCGKCYLGDSFRCGSCPYKGLPAFKPGDKLKLMDQGQVVVQTGQVKVQSGKVKIQL